MPNLHAGPGKHDPSDRECPAARHVPRHQRRPENLVRAGPAGLLPRRRGCRSRGTDHDRGARSAPGRAATGQLGPRQRRAAHVRNRPACGPSRTSRAAGEGVVLSKITVIGTGYVGLTTGAYMAHIGHEVICLDVIPEKVEALLRGEVPIFETGLEELIHGSVDTDNLHFSLDREASVAGAEFVFLCLPTPQGEDGSADLSYVRTEAEVLGPLLETGCIVIN